MHSSILEFRAVPSFSEWHYQIMLSTGQLVEPLYIAKVQSYSAKGAMVGVGGVSPLAGEGVVWVASPRTF